MSLDEMVDGAGRIRPAWRRVFDVVRVLGAAGLAERGRLLDGFVAAEGPSGLRGGRGAGALRLDPVPLLLDAAEFGRIAAGLAGRARLLDRVIRDLLGPQTLFAAGAVPPGAVLGGRHFVRPARGGVDRPPMLLYGADLVRVADGSWRVLADLCFRPGGIGMVPTRHAQLRRALPEYFRDDVAAPDRFFERWRDALGERRPAGYDENGALAVLGEGFPDPDWFEHVELARALGCALVQGGDLTVRGGLLWQKHLAGLRRVDVLLGRQAAHRLDPLELDWTAGAGVPGLMALIRAGRVGFANDPGASVGEAPALAPYLPALAPRLIGDAPFLPGVETHWLGDPAGRAAVTRTPPERWRLRSATDPELPPVDPASLGLRARQRLAEATASDPAGFVAVDAVEPSLAPCAGENGLVPAPVSLRLFLLRDGDDHWFPLPSGIGRVLGPAGWAGPSLHGIGPLKPVLVVRTGDEDEGDAPLAASTRSASSLAPPSAPRRPVRPTDAEMPARVAAEFYALGQASERLSSIARVLGALFPRLAAFGGRPRERVELGVLGACLGRTGLLPSELTVEPDRTGVAALAAPLVRPDGPLGRSVRREARRLDGLRDRLGVTTIAILSRSLGDVLDRFATDGSPERSPALAAAILGFSATLGGVVAESMVRSGGRRFLELGRSLARAETGAAELALALGPAATLKLPVGRGAHSAPDLATSLALLLELSDSAVTYRGRYPGALDPAFALDLLLAERANPRAVGAALARAAAELGGGPQSDEQALAIELERLGETIDGVAAAALAAGPDEGAIAALAPLLGRAAASIGAVRDEARRRLLDLLPSMREISGG